MTETLRVASGHHFAYAPQYIATANDNFAQRGLSVDLQAHETGFTGIVNSLATGESDLVLGSALFALRLARESAVDPVLVAQPNQQTRHVLMARPGEWAGGFEWSMLRDKSVLVFPSPVPTPWAAFRAVLKRHDLDLEAVNPIVGFKPEAALAEFARGEGDLLLVDHEPAKGTDFAEVVTLAEALGPIPWSVYCTSTTIAADRPEAIAAFREALGEAIAWIYQQDARTVAESLADFFPDIEPEDLTTYMARYQKMQLWRTGADVAADQLQRWEDALKSAKLMQSAESLTALLADSASPAGATGSHE